MTKDQILAIKQDRIKKLSNNPKNIKAPGVVRKLNRQIRNLSK